MKSTIPLRVIGLAFIFAGIVLFAISRGTAPLTHPLPPISAPTGLPSDDIIPSKGQIAWKYGDKVAVRTFKTNESSKFIAEQSLNGASWRNQIGVEWQTNLLGWQLHTQTRPLVVYTNDEWLISLRETAQSSATIQMAMFEKDKAEQGTNFVPKGFLRLPILMDFSTGNLWAYENGQWIEFERKK